MQAGKLRHRITLQEPVKEQNPTTGSVINTGAMSQPLWAEVAALSAREFIAAQPLRARLPPRITIRYREGVTRKHRILFRGRIYNIEGVLPDPRSGREYLTLPCSEGLTMADGVEVNLTGLDSVLRGNWMPSHRSLAINPVVQRCVKRQTSSGTERAIMPRGLMILSPKRLSTKNIVVSFSSKAFLQNRRSNVSCRGDGGAGQYANTKANVRKGRAGKKL